MFLHALPAAPEGTALSARFCLTEHARDDDDDDAPPVHDVNLTVSQIAPYAPPASGAAPKLSLRFALADVPASAAGDWTLDDAQRDKLMVLGSMLGLAAARWTPAGVLGLLLAGCGCAQLDEHACFAALLKASRSAHRDELLARAGSLF